MERCLALADSHRVRYARERVGSGFGSASRCCCRQARASPARCRTAATYAISKELSIGAGVGHLLPGEFLGQSTTTTPAWAPYLMWNVKF
jgi:hypothetical protein